MDRLLFSSDGRGWRRVTLHGRETVAFHPQIAAIVRARLGEEHALLFARPRIGEKGLIEWRTDRQGIARPVGELDAEARQRLKERRAALEADLRKLAEALKAEGDSASLVGHMLLRALHAPPSGSLWSVGGAPVLVGWGHVLEGTPAIPDPPGQWREPIVAPPPASLFKLPPRVSGGESAPTALPSLWRRRRVWAGLLLVLALVLLVLGLAPRGCAPPADEPSPPTDQAAPAPEPMVPPPPEPIVPPLEPPEPPPPAEQGTAETRARAKACATSIAKRAASPIAVVFDTSGSMNLGMNISMGDLRRIERELRSPDLLTRLSALRQWKELQAEPVPLGGRRIDVARDVFARALRNVDPARLSTVTFPDKCAIRSDHGLAALEAIRTLPAAAGTPLAAAIARAAEIVSTGLGSGAKGHVVVLSDGGDSCGGDVCAVGRMIAERNPNVVVDVIEIARDSGLECVSRATGGFYRAAAEAVDLGKLVDNVVQVASGKACGAAPR